MAVVYIREQGSSVRKRGGRMLVTAKDRSTILMEIPMRNLTAVAVFGGVQITTQAMAEFLDAGVAVALFTRSGRLKGHVVPAVHRQCISTIASIRSAPLGNAQFRDGSWHCPAEDPEPTQSD